MAGPGPDANLGQLEGRNLTAPGPVLPNPQITNGGRKLERTIPPEPGALRSGHFPPAQPSRFAPAETRIRVNWRRDEPTLSRKVVTRKRDCETHQNTERDVPGQKDHSRDRLNSPNGVTPRHVFPTPCFFSYQPCTAYALVVAACEVGRNCHLSIA